MLPEDAFSPIYVDYSEEFAGNLAGYQGRDIFKQFYNDTYNAQYYYGASPEESESTQTGYGSYLLYKMDNSTK